MQGFLLGLSNGTTCIAYCAPVLVPYLIGKGDSTSKNFWHLMQFLLGRLLGYMIFAIVAWEAGRLLLNIDKYKEPVFGVVYIVLSLTMILYAIFNPHTVCGVNTLRGYITKYINEKSWLMPVFLGFLTGLNLCPPFLLAFTGASNSQGILQSILFFFTFFLGTSIYFIPMPFIGTFNNRSQIRTIGKMAAVVIALYYLYTGVIMLIGGIKLL